MSKIGLVALLAGIVLGYGNPVLAQEGGAVQPDGVSTGEDKKRGGAAIDHRSEKANENSNAQWSTGATKGKDRADLRHQQNQDRKQGKKNDKDGDGVEDHDRKNDDSDKARGNDKDSDGGKVKKDHGDKVKKDHDGKVKKDRGGKVKKNHGGKAGGHGKNK